LGVAQKFGTSLATVNRVGQQKNKSNFGETTMAMEKKSLVSKAASTPKSKTTKSKFDTSKPAASKVIAAKKQGNPNSN
jgi:hypothetical protein